MNLFMKQKQTQRHWNKNLWLSKGKWWGDYLGIWD